MTTFLFWNVNGIKLPQLVAAAAHEYRVDVLLLAECEDPRSILRALNSPSDMGYNYHHNPASEVEIFSRFPLSSIQQIRDHEGLSFRHLIPPIGVDVLLIAAHLRSKLNNTEANQRFATTRLKQVIDEVEADMPHRRTLVVGDLNMSPFEEGMIAAEGLNSTMSRQMALKRTRTVSGQPYPFFFNPMWSHLGDKGVRPPGTYFYGSGGSVSLFWHMFDQLLLRPELLDYFREESLQIVTSIGGDTLLDRQGRPNRNFASDHLPISFSLDLIGGIYDRG